MNPNDILDQMLGFLAPSSQVCACGGTGIDSVRKMGTEGYLVVRCVCGTEPSVEAQVAALDAAGAISHNVAADCGCKYCISYNDEIDNCEFVGKPLCECGCHP